MQSDPSGRGQTPIDFLTGMLVFFVVVGFVLLFVPGLLEPTQGDQETSLVADRVGDQLVEFHLGDPGTATLNTCAFWFFNQSGSSPCDTFDTDAALTDQVGIDDRYRVNVTVRNVTGGPEREVLCADGNVVVPCSSGGSPLAVGPSPQSGEGSVATAQRHVSLDGTTAELRVEVW